MTIGTNINRSIAVLAIALSAGCAATSAETAPADVMTAFSPSNRPSSYLGEAGLPDGMKLIPPAPRPGSPDLARDAEASTRALALRGGPRWELATRDADLFTPGATAAMACAAGRQVDSAATPLTYKLLIRAAIDFSGSTASTKNHYGRSRPFMTNGQPTCTPEAEKVLRVNGSYPSGHSAIGYGWGLVLAQLLPDRATDLVARGIAFGDSRRVCNAHWLSDVEQGRTTAAATFARLQSSPDFQADVAAAREELGQRAPVAPAQDCAAEAAALAQS
jgi:acid phosphatase (class A)